MMPRQRTLLDGDTGAKFDSLELKVGDAASGGAVTSVFTRTGDVVAETDDYKASQVENDSEVDGAHVSEALNALNGNGPPGGYMWVAASAPAVAADRYPYFFYGGVVVQATELVCQLVVTRDFIARYFCFVATGSLPTDTLLCTLRKNGVDTALTFTVPAGTAPGTVIADAAHVVDFAKGDLISVRLRQSGTQASGGWDGRWSVG